MTVISVGRCNQAATLVADRVGQYVDEPVPLQVE
jgi:hypothetical protein